MAEQLLKIGAVTKIAGQVSARHPDGRSEPLHAGSPIYQGDLLETGGDGRVGVEFADKSTFSLGPKGRMSMDEMVFDPAQPQSGHSTIAALNGAFTFVSGQIAKNAPDAMQVKTPVMTIGVRGTSGAGVAGPEGSANTVTLLRDGNGALGQIVISNAAGSMVLNGESHTIQLSSFVQPPPRPTAMSAAQVQEMYGNALSAQSQAPAEPPANPAQPTNGDQQGGAGGAQDAAGTHLAAQLADPANAEQLVSFVDATLGAIVDVQLAAEISEMLGDLLTWTMVWADDVEGDYNALLGDIAADDLAFWAFLEMLADEDFEWLFEDLDMETGVVLYGTPGDDVLAGTEYGDLIFGEQGDDVLYGLDGDDELDGGTGADIIDAGDGDDIVDMDRDGANDDVTGGDGVDTLSYANCASAVTVILDAAGDGTVVDSSASDTFHGFENIEGSASGDTLTGNAHDNTLWGGGGDDVLTGEGGDDELYGGGGNDILIGGAGTDTLEGGAGGDLFRFTQAPVNLDTDYIVDFTTGADKIQLGSTGFGMVAGDLIDGTNYFELTLGVSDTLATSSLGAVSGAGIIAVREYGSDDVALYYTATLEDLSLTSYQIATLGDTDLTGIQASDVTVFTAP